MKKLLYTTSALVGAAFLMEAVVPAKAEVNMSLRYRAALISQDKKDDDKRNLNDNGVKHRSIALNSAKINIDLSASKDHPNGLTTGANLAIATASRKLDYDNAFGYISGSFGKIDIGDTHDVGYRTLGYGVPGTSNFGAVDAGFQPSGTPYINTSATGNIGARASTLTYWSPSFSGAQIGVSWTPQVKTVATAAGVKDGSLAVIPSKPAVEGKDASHNTADGSIEDSLAFVASYSGSFGGTGVSMGVAMEQAKTRASEPDPYTDPSALTMLVGTGGTSLNPVGSITAATAASDTGTSGSNKYSDINVSRKNQDPTAFAGYVSFDIQGFTVGGSYGSWESDAANSASVSEHTAYALGASYSVDAITFGLGWSQASTDTTHHNIRVNKNTPQAGSNGVTVALVTGSTPYKQTLDRSILAFTTSYQLGDGAAIDFVIEQGSSESMVSPTLGAGSNNGVAIGKKETDHSGFGVGIDLKF